MNKELQEQAKQDEAMIEMVAPRMVEFIKQTFEALTDKAELSIQETGMFNECKSILSMLPNEPSGLYKVVSKDFIRHELDMFGDEDVPSGVVVLGKMDGKFHIATKEDYVLYYSEYWTDLEWYEVEGDFDPADISRNEKN